MIIKLFSQFYKISRRPSFRQTFRNIFVKFIDVQIEQTNQQMKPRDRKLNLNESAVLKSDNKTYSVIETYCI